jgi:hypothetical protein
MLVNGVKRFRTYGNNNQRRGKTLRLPVVLILWKVRVLIGESSGEEHYAYIPAGATMYGPRLPMAADYATGFRSDDRYYFCPPHSRRVTSSRSQSGITR